MRKGNSVNFYLPETFKAEFSKCQWEMEDAFIPTQRENRNAENVYFIVVPIIFLITGNVN